MAKVTQWRSPMQWLGWNEHRRCYMQAKRFWIDVFFRISLSTSQRCLLSSWRGRWADFNYKWACKACVFYRVKNLSRLSHGSEASPTIRPFHRHSAPSVLTPTKGSSHPLDRFSIFLPRFDDYSFNYDEYLDMEEYWEESNQVFSCNIIILVYFFQNNVNETFLFSGGGGEYFLQRHHTATTL